MLDTPRLTTARLVLEPLTIAAAPEMVTVLSDPSLYRHIGGAPPDVSALAAQYALQANLQSPDGTSRRLNWIARRADSLEAVGYVQATVVVATGDADVAWVLGARFQGRGYATEAADAMLAWLESQDGTRRVTAHIGPRNVASQRVAGRLGFVASLQLVGGETVWERR